MHYAFFSKCCSAPCLVRGTESAKFYACAACHEPTTRKRLKFDSYEQFQRKVDIGLFHVSDRLTRPKPKNNVYGILFVAIVTFLVLVLIAEAAR